MWEDGRLCAHETATLAQGATQALVPMLARVMAQARCGFDNVDRLGVTIGPGHFTGLRAGLAVARGLQLARTLPVVAVTTLEALAAATQESERQGRRVVVALDSKRSEPYFQTFDSNLMPMDSPTFMEVDVFVAALEPSPLLVVGDAAPALMAGLERRGRTAKWEAGARHPDAAVVAALAATRAPLAGPVQPLYLHAPAARPMARPVSTP